MIIGGMDLHNDSFLVQDFPMLIFRLGFGSPLVRADLVDQNIVFVPTIQSHPLLVLVASHGGHVFAHKWVLAQMCIDLAELYAEASNLDLVLRTASTLNRAIWQKPPELPGSEPTSCHECLANTAPQG
ncbi:hypothetical protein HGRIS_002974 [Hohenbuehelia grisea]|uniref:Uncharacterized protein n=1 Tax=Hohenbuehelia grisea TaxID=104357 RepID=A0ABR3JMB1_9AGAR